MGNPKQTQKEFVDQITVEEVGQFLKEIGYKFTPCDNFGINLESFENNKQEYYALKFFRSLSDYSNSEYQVFVSLYKIRIAQWRAPFRCRTYEREWRNFLIMHHGKAYIDCYEKSKNETIKQEIEEHNRKIQKERDELLKEICTLKATAIVL